MGQYIIEFAKYATALFASLYTYECFAVFRYHTERERSGIYIRQNLLMFLVHLSCFLPLYCKNGQVEYIFFFAFQQIALYAVIVLYHMLYPRASRLIINNMCFLMAIGFVILTRLSYDKAVRQFIIAVISCVLAFIIPKLMETMPNPAGFVWCYAALGIFLLLIVLLLGSVTNGSRLSFAVFGITFQPSEFVKIIFVFCIAALLARSAAFWNIALSALIAGAHVLILVLSKDLGSALIYFVAYVVMVYLATGKERYLFAGAFGGGFFAYVAYHLFAHIRVRVQAWRDPWSVIDKEGYQITQSLFAIGCGGLFGLGMGQGSPSSIPYVETDFIFSAVVEELGILFSFCLLLVYMSCFIVFMQIALSLRDIFARLAVSGLGVVYIFQIFLTIGGGIKFIPLTGVTLPLISYGGSSVLSTILMFAMIQGLYLLGGSHGGKKKESARAKKQQ